MIGIVDYSAGNIKSVERALDFIKVPFVCSKNPKDLLDAKVEKVIFPGVGDASYSMKMLKKSGYDVFLKDWAQSGKPLTGICLGSQIIFDYSEEGDVQCLGLIKGRIHHFSKLYEEKGVDSCSLKIPHMGWSDISWKNGGSKYLDGIAEHSDFYFVHSYVICPDDSSVVKAFCDYGVQVPACVEKDNITAFQFHPEKSGENGLKILKNFCFGENN